MSGVSVSLAAIRAQMDAVDARVVTVETRPAADLTVTGARDFTGAITKDQNAVWHEGDAAVLLARADEALLGPADDLDTVTDKGWYSWGGTGSEPANAPCTYGVMKVSKDSGRFVQVIDSPRNNSGYMRRQTGGGWLSWVRFLVDVVDGVRMDAIEQRLDLIEAPSWVVGSKIQAGAVTPSKLDRAYLDYDKVYSGRVFSGTVLNPNAGLPVGWVYTRQNEGTYQIDVVGVSPSWSSGSGRRVFVTPSDGFGFNVSVCVIYNSAGFQVKTYNSSTASKLDSGFSFVVMAAGPHVA